MKYILGITIMIWSVFSSAKYYPEVVVNEEDGFVDLKFTISNAKKLDSGAFEISVNGNLRGEKVGFSIELQPSWDSQDVEGVDEPFYWGEALFKSVGSESEAFIKSLAGLYGAIVKDITVSDVVLARVVGLACNPSEVHASPCKTKFFFNSEGSEELYSEVFINVDLSAKSLEFNEKDTEYRVPLLRSLLQ